jgi:hypothetical protein
MIIIIKIITCKYAYIYIYIYTHIHIYKGKDNCKVHPRTGHEVPEVVRGRCIALLFL